MPLQPGSRFGPYEVTALIGAGGMGEVYRARDTKLKRDVALKVLPREFVDEPERLARFQREAEVLASLNHPNIAHIYGLEEGAGATALVLELVEGPTLAERIAEGAIPVDEALDIAQQITRALEAAHALGIIHRDLKPANVKITPEGVVKVLDFGLAKAFTTDETAAPESSLSPTLTKGTGMGVILGTAAYMSPEQAKGKPVDTRTDVWAFGAVLYEMLTGERAFQGEDVSDTLVSVFRDEPDWSKLPGDVPSSVRQAMRVCLLKDAKERVRDIAAVRLAMQGAFETEPPPIAAATERSPKRTLTVALVALGVLAGFVIGAMSYRRPTDSKVVRASIVLPELQSRTGTSRRSVAVSPGGTHVAYVADRQLYLRALDELESVPVRGTEGTNPVLPFFSPDGLWIGFYSARDGVLAKVPLTGGAPVALSSNDGSPAGASWSADGTIIYGSLRGVVRVSADGGEPEVVLASDAVYSQPQLLPDGRHVLFTGYRNIQDDGQIFVQSLDTGERRLLVDGGKDARYVPTGHLVYGFGRDLVAVRFDPDRLEITGGPVPVVEDVSQAEVWGSNHDISGDGTLVYVPGRSQNLPRTLVWVDREGREEPIGAESRAYNRVRISPDGTKALLERGDDDVDLWLWDFARETSTRLTVDPSADYHAAWSPEGKHVVFSSGRDGTENVYRKAVDGTGVVEHLFESDTRRIPFAFTPDGATLLFQEIRYEGQPFSFWTLTLGDEMTAQPLLDTGFVVDEAALSRDGRWLAYTSDVSGEYEIYVRPFPDVDSRRWQISSGGGRFPVWGPDGTELFFGTLDGALMRVAVDTEPMFQAGNPETVLEAGSYFVTPLNRAFDISSDGTRFLMLKQDAAEATDDPYAGVDQIIVVHNWFEELKTRVPVD